MISKLKNNSGFTLVELVVVILVGMILSTIAIPMFSSWRDSMYVKSAATDLYSCIQETRMIAIKDNTTMAIVFDTVNNRYYRCDDWGADGSWSGTGDNTGAGDNNIIQTFSIDSGLSGVNYGNGNITDTGTNSVTNGAFPAGGVSYTNQVLVINPQGVGSGGYVYLENREQDSIFAVGTRSSGLVRSLRWNGGGWQ